MSTKADDRDMIIAKTEMPPGWAEFLTKWLSRTVNFLTDRQCSRKQTGHADLHDHDDGLYYNARSMLSDVRQSSGAGSSYE